MLIKVTSVIITDNLLNLMAYSGEKGLSHTVIQGPTLTECWHCQYLVWRDSLRHHEKAPKTRWASFRYNCYWKRINVYHKQCRQIKNILAWPFLLKMTSVDPDSHLTQKWTRSSAGCFPRFFICPFSFPTSFHWGRQYVAGWLRVCALEWRQTQVQVIALLLTSFGSLTWSLWTGKCCKPYFKVQFLNGVKNNAYLLGLH